ncbi:MAG: EamA family transporter, partial [Pseudomonadota bacterium]
MPIQHTLALLMVCIIWAGNFIAAASAVQHVSGLEFTLIRFVLVLALLWPWLRKPAPGQWLNLILACIGMGALHFGLVFMAVARSVDISSIAILMQIYVPMTTLLAVVMLNERIGWRTASGIAIAFFGVL